MLINTTIDKKSTTVFCLSSSTLSLVDRCCCCSYQLECLSGITCCLCKFESFCIFPSVYLYNIDWLFIFPVCLFYYCIQMYVHERMSECIVCFISSNILWISYGYYGFRVKIGKFLLSSCQLDFQSSLKITRIFVILDL